MSASAGLDWAAGADGGGPDQSPAAMTLSPATMATSLQIEFALLDGRSAVMVVAIGAAIGTAVPTSRIIRIDPAKALRSE